MPSRLTLMPVLRVSSACVIALVLLAGCGSSSDSAGSAPHSADSSSSHSADSPSVSSNTPTASPTPTVTPATGVQLKKIVLRPGDLPSSWKAAPAQPDSSSSSDQAELTRCTGGRNTDKDQVATTDSDDYSFGNATISSSATSYKSRSDLDSDLALLKSPKLATCYNQLLKKQLRTSMPKGAGLGAVSVRFTPGPGAGPANVAGSGSATVSVSVGGQHVKVYVNFVYLTGPLIEAEVDAENVGSPVPAGVLQAAVKAVAHRAATYS